LALFGCSGAEEEVDQVGTLELIHDDSGLHGTYVIDEVRSIGFTSTLRGEELRLALDVNPLLTITSSINRQTRDIVLTVPDGAMLTPEDSRNINLFHQALLLEFGTGDLGDPEVIGLVNITGMWAEKSTGALVSHQTQFPAKQGWTSLCSSLYTWRAADHDCDYYNWGQDATLVAIGNYATGAASNNGTSYANWVNGGWSYPSQSGAYNSHPTNVNYEWGSCYGECGNGCGSPDYTVDCLNHDHCVRNHGHAMASLYCNDQFASTLDDAVAEWLGGAPLCW
jgi:hypothetical protein